MFEENNEYKLLVFNAKVVEHCNLSALRLRTALSAKEILEIIIDRQDNLKLNK